MQIDAMTARFWEYLNGDWVKITLRPGQKLAWFTGGPTDEGFYSEYHTWEHTGTHIVSELSTSARDCDGPLETDSVYTCHIGNLDGLRHSRLPADVLGTPQWETVSRSQRDRFAEAMGY